MQLTFENLPISRCACNKHNKQEGNHDHIEAGKFQSNDVYETCIDNGTGAFLKVDAYLYEYQHIALLSDNFRVFILWIIVGWQDMNILHIVNTVAKLSKGHPNIGCIVLQRRREKEKT